MDRIKLKFKSILTQKGIKENADYDDMAGPLLVCVIFGVLLLFVSFNFANFKLTSVKINIINRKERFNSVTSMGSVSQDVSVSTLSST